MASEQETYLDRGRRRHPLRWVLLALLLVAAVLAALVLWHRNHAAPSAEGCQVTPAGGKPVTMEVDQGANAATIAAVTLSRGLPERALVIALATGLQESKLHNLEGGDRDSIGLFQQRPSQGWGTAQQIADPVYSTNKFLDQLVAVPGYARMRLTDAAQRVQKSGYPEAYAKHEGNAQLLADALTGRTPATFTCTVHSFALPEPVADVSGSPAGSPGASPSAGQQPSPQLVTERLKREFGRAVTTQAGSQPGTLALVPAPVAPDPSAAEPASAADALTAGDAKRQTGWAVAAWAVAHAQDLGIGSVHFDGKAWRLDRSDAGWTTQPDPAATDRVQLTLGLPAAKR
ncbi:hypothetical protein [Streptomyces tateyamensis]|uniref:hypothetical protein n=1 Tax=Streptomyces tateyamensis TaxID=565073 RepID=UPI0011B40871|nr:hypothetical protein [Streptomyces tateyamensis]